MLNTAIVANLSKSLNNEIAKKLFSTQVSKILAESGDSDLKVLRHGEAADLAFRMYKEYISSKDFTYYVNWMRDLDNMIFKYRGNQPLNLETLEDDDEEEDHRRRKGKKNRSKGVRSFAPPVPPRDDDADVSIPDEKSVTISSEKLKQMKQKAKNSIK